MRPTLLAILLAAAMLTAACSSTPSNEEGSTVPEAETSIAEADPETSPSESDDEEADVQASAAEPTSDGGPRTVVSSDVPLLPGGSVLPADRDGPSVELVTLREDPYLGAAIYPRPDYEGNPWSQWGQGIALEDGRVITAVGDHLGADANSYLYEYDPDTRTLTRFADVMSAVDHSPQSWGYGKIHSQMVDGGDGGIFFTTYYGSRRGLSFEGSYEGDILFRLDKTTLDLQPITVPVPRHGVPSLATDGRGLIYGEAVDPLLDDETYPGGGFFVFDASDGAVRRFDADPRHDTFRNVMVSADGTAWFAGEGNSLFRYEPTSDELELSDVTLASPLRASTAPTGDGTIYGVTQDPYNLFAFEPDGGTRQLGQAVWYTTSLALTADESGVLYVPGAHGDSWEYGSPLINVDTQSGEQTTVVELLDPIQEAFGVTLGGTYSVTVDATRNHAHIGFNAGPTGDSPWGEVVFVVVELE